MEKFIIWHWQRRNKKVDVARLQLPRSTNKTTNKNGSTIEGLLGTLPHKDMETRHFKPAPPNIDNSISQNDNSVKNNTITNNNYIQDNRNNTKKDSGGLTKNAN